jgi:hypothetical protein
VLITQFGGRQQNISELDIFQALCFLACLKWDLIILLGMYFAFHTLSFWALSRRARRVVG